MQELCIMMMMIKSSTVVLEKNLTRTLFSSLDEEVMKDSVSMQNHKGNFAKAMYNYARSNFQCRFSLVHLTFYGIVLNAVGQKTF